MVMKPVDGAARDVFRHPFDLVIEGPAIPAVEVALVLEEEIGGNGMKFARHHARSHVGEEPAAGGAVNVVEPPFAFLGRSLRTGIVQPFGVLGKTGVGRVNPFASAGAGGR